MQQTEHYKLNLIESSDPFSPNPLNENAEKTEAALSALDGAGEALAQRVQVLELKRIVTGTYCGDNAAGHVIEIGFTPKAVLIGQPNPIDWSHAVCVPEQDDVIESYKALVSIVEGGFRVGAYAARSLNMASQYYNYIAFA